MIICSRCKTENNESSKFCCQCGNDLTINADAPANEDLKSLADSLNEQAVHTEKQPFNLNKAICDAPKKLWAGIKKSVFFRKKKNTIITFAVPIIALFLIFVIINLPCRHKNWYEATCTEQRTCQECGYVEGEPLGHQFDDATCEKAKKCIRCHYIEGEPLGHQISELTCTEDGVCSVCNKKIPAKGHTWTDPTCTLPSKCEVCNEEGEAAYGHNFIGDTCATCGAENKVVFKTNKLLYSSDGIEIVYLGYDYEESSYGDFNLNFKITNNSGHTECIQLRDESINGYMCDFTMSEDVLNGKSAFSDASIGHYDLKKVGLSSFFEIKNIQFKFIRCESGHIKSNVISLNIN